VALVFLASTLKLCLLALVFLDSTLGCRLLMRLLLRFLDLILCALTPVVRAFVLALALAFPLSPVLVAADNVAALQETKVAVARVKAVLIFDLFFVSGLFIF